MSGNERAHLEQCVRDAVDLSGAASRTKPAKAAADSEQPDAVASREIALGERRGGLDGSVERSSARALEVGEDVEDQHDRGIALRMQLVDNELAGSRGRPPVDPPQVIARDERPQLGELDSFAFRARDLVADRSLGLARAGDGSQHDLLGVDAKRFSELDLVFVGDQPEPVVPADAYTRI